MLNWQQASAHSVGWFFSFQQQNPTACRRFLHRPTLNTHAQIRRRVTVGSDGSAVNLQVRSTVCCFVWWLHTAGTQSSHWQLCDALLTSGWFKGPVGFWGKRSDRVKIQILVYLWKMWCMLADIWCNVEQHTWNGQLGSWSVLSESRGQCQHPSSCPQLQALMNRYFPPFKINISCSVISHFWTDFKLNGEQHGRVTSTEKHWNAKVFCQNS